MQWSHSRVEAFEKCPFNFKMRYLEGAEVNSPIDADNALIVGTALHTGIEKDVQTALKEYFFSYPIISDAHINEAIKLETMIPKAKAILPSGEYEVEIKDGDFHGFIDLLAPATVFERGVELPNTYDIYDFKYSNNENHYKESNQLHLYKYFFEKCNPGKHIRNLYFVFVPKVNIKQKKTEDLMQFRQRIRDKLNESEPHIVQVEYNPERVIDFLLKVKTISESTEYPQNQSWFCRYCDYQEFCLKGWDYFMKLPSKERRNLEKVEKRVIWIYGVPFCGKTTFANAFPDPLMLNTDGNIKFVDAPYIRIKDEVKVEGRLTKRTLAWAVFKDIIAELEKKENEFKTIVVDLVEDLYDFCRLYMYDQLGIKHESDDSFKAWDMVRGEFLNTLKRLMALDYENIILISHEDTSKDITKKGGDKITAIKPNMQDKVALKVAGMVDIVARIVADGNQRTFNFKSDEVIFGGGRLTVTQKEIPLDVNALFTVYDEANRRAVRKAQEGTTAHETEQVTNNPTNEETPTEAPKAAKTRRRKTQEEPAPAEPVNEAADEGQTDDAPTDVSTETDTSTDAPTETPEAETEQSKAEVPKRTRRTRKTTTE